MPQSLTINERDARSDNEMEKQPADKAREMVLAVELDEAELACRILEAIVGYRRPVGMTAEEALATQDEQSRNDVRHAAVAAMRYLTERINAGSSVS